MNNLRREIEDLKNHHSKEAFNRIYDSYSKSLYGYLLKVLKRSEVAEEILQETFLKMIDKIEYFKMGEDIEKSFKGWLFRLSTNLTFDYLRKQKIKKKYQEKLIGENNDENPLHQIIEAEKKTVFENMVKRLKASDRMFLSLKVYHGFSYMEISRMIGISENAVKQRFFRAKMALKDLSLKMESLR